MSRITSMAITKVNRTERGIVTSVKVVFFDSRGEEVQSQMFPAEMFSEVQLAVDKPYIELRFVERANTTKESPQTSS